MDYNRQADVLKAMAHPTRLHVLDMLRQGEICVCHIENALGKRQAYVSQQLMVLREAGIVSHRREGLQVYYRIADDAILRLLNFLMGAPSDYQPIQGCPCPRCAVVMLTEIQ